MNLCYFPEKLNSTKNLASSREDRNITTSSHTSTCKQILQGIYNNKLPNKKYIFFFLSVCIKIIIIEGKKKGIMQTKDSMNDLDPLICERLAQ